MNLTSRRARTLLALCSVGAVVGAGVTATSAFAAGETITFSPTTTSATITNIDPTTSTTNAALAYGMKIVPTSTDTHALRVDELTGPGPLYVERASTNDTPAANPGGTGLGRSVTTGATHGKTVTSADAAFRDADVNGTISGTGIAGGATIASRTSDTEVELSDATTASSTASLALTVNPPSRPAADAMVETTGCAGACVTTVTSTVAAFVDASADAGGDIGAAISGTGIPANNTIASISGNVATLTTAAGSNGGPTAAADAAIDPPSAVRTAVGQTYGKTLTSTSEFKSTDVGLSVSGNGIPANTTIASYTSTSSVELSNATTATASGLTLAIGVSSRSVTDGVTKGKTVTSATAAFSTTDLGATITGTGIPSSTTITGINSTSSVDLSNATTASGTGVSITITPRVRNVTDGVTNSTTTLTSATAQFTANDEGATVSGSGIPSGDTIATYVSATQVTLATAATASGSNVSLTITPAARTKADGATYAKNFSSATAAFTDSDVASTIAGLGIPADTTISTRTDGTSVEMSAATTASATGLTATITPSGAATVDGTAAATTLTATGSAATLDGHIIRIAKTGETTEIVKVLTVSGTTLNLDRKLAASHSGASIMDLGDASGINPFTTVGPGTSAPVSRYADGDNLYFGAVVPGTYTFRLYKDHNGSGSYESDIDDATSTFTLTVKDVNGATTTTSDDLSPTLSVASTAGVGGNVQASVATGLTTTDIRGLNGGSPSVGHLGLAIAAASTLDLDGLYLPRTGTGFASKSFDGTSVTATSGPALIGTSTTAYTIGSAISRTSSTVVGTNSVATVDEDVTNVVGSVKDDTGTSARTVHVKVGVADATYTATVKNSSAAAVSGATVRFTLITGTNTPALTADGTLVSSTSTTKVYTAISNSSGVATLKVTSGTTTAGTTYTVQPSTNGVSGDVLSAAYEAVAATTLENTNTDASLIVTPGSSATLTGKLLDQFGAAYVPSGSDSVQVAVRIPAGGTTVGNAAIADGAFSYTYTPTTAPTAGTQTTFDFYYNATTPLDGTNSAINWASTATASSVTITAPVASASVTQQKATVTPSAGTMVTGSVLDSSSAGLAYKTVTLSGTAGVYFSNLSAPTSSSTDDLATTITVASNGSGVYTGYAYFTKAGAATITATSGSATKTVDVVVTQAADPFAVTASDAVVEPGGTSVVSGSLQNGFGYPVSGESVDLSLGATTAATLGATQVTTNSDGVWSTTLTGASGGSGTATLTATIHGKTANATAHVDWLDNAGLTIADGTYQTTATVTVDPTINATTITGPESQVGAGYAALSGTAKPSTAVEVYGKLSASSAAYGLVGMVISDTDGSWSSSQYISATTTFFAKTSYSTSSPITVTVEAEPAPTEPSTVSLSAKAVGGGKVYLVGDGGPTGYGVMKFYKWTGSSWQYIAGVIANPHGDYGFYYKTTTGSKTFRCVYIAPDHTAAGANATVTVK